MTGAIPTIRTERLTLRAHRMSDFEPLAEALASSHARFLGGPFSQKDAWADFCRAVAQWHLLGHGALAIDQSESGAFLGQISLSQPPYFPEPEIGWIVLPSVQGKGIASEAAEAVRTWVYANTPIRSLVSYIHRENHRSIRLAERLDAALDNHAPPAPYADHLVYRHPSPGAAS